MIGPEPGPPIWAKHEETRRTGTPQRLHYSSSNFLYRRLDDHHPLPHRDHPRS